MARSTSRGACIISVVGALLIGAGCAGAKHRTSFNRNDALILDDGTLVLKGFGATDAGSITCVIRPGAHGSKSSSNTKASLKVLEYASGEVNHEAKREAMLLYAQTERLAALDSIFSQYCIMFGNGVFGGLDDPKTFTKYNDAIGALLDRFSGDALKPVEPRGTDAKAEAEAKAKADADAKAAAAAAALAGQPPPK